MTKLEQLALKNETQVEPLLGEEINWWMVSTMFMLGVVSTLGILIAVGVKLVV